LKQAVNVFGAKRAHVGSKSDPYAEFT
jgi:hypothetical protein